jgi:hypothetical protein
MHPAFEIEAKIRTYLAGTIRLEELRNWFRPSRGALFALPPGTRPLELASTLMLGIQELDQGGFSERQLKRELRNALDQTFQVSLESEPVLTTSSNETTTGATSILLASDNKDTTITTLQLTPTGR